ncbi:glycoside hydrolase family 66 protein [Metabacillus sp. Hm71]|uniref:glycoside hydrolase family 66 protein n=1 Tax=Metabacillus sp. Hm71 TaxID=3450743 RepID=UPI003F439FB8
MLSKKVNILIFLSIILLLLIIIGVTKYPSSSPHYDSKKETSYIIPEHTNMIKNISTDKAAYHVKDTVKFTAQLTNGHSNGMLIITYYHLGNILFKQEVKVTNKEAKWEWQPPKEDFKGYFVHVQYTSNTKQDSQTIAVDVSSDWSKFPRYGFLSNFQDLSFKEMQSVISRLNRYHINGLQFYDWHYKHHQPLIMENNEPVPYWEDIANRPTSLLTIRKYIDLAHERNMKTMAYNLLYGAFAEAEKEGVKTEWRLFKDRQGHAHDYHALPDDWKSDVFMVNPGNPEWQTYIIGQQKSVYHALPFDGWHIDQLGPRGEVYDVNGNQVAIDHTFRPFLEKIKSETMDKRIVMNAVNQFGQKQIAESTIDFLYTEVWDRYKYYGDLKRIIDENEHYSEGNKNTVLAAYMNYEFSNQPGEFNTPGVLLANSVIFAAGGSHLELGEHMLSKEYFPHKNLKIAQSLQSSLIKYYDFLVAYENLLRDNLQEVPISIHSHDRVLFSSQPEQGKVWYYAKQKMNIKVIHFINFVDAKTLEWRDTNGSQAEPQDRKQLNVQLKETRSIKKIWLASPDIQNGIPISLPFKQENEEVRFTLPSLKYWDMVVIEYK